MLIVSYLRHRDQKRGIARAEMVLSKISFVTGDKVLVLVRSYMFEYGFCTLSMVSFTNVYSSECV